MKKLKLLVAEGNVPEENEFFKSKGIRTHTESLKESISNYYSDFEIDVIQPTINLSLNEIIPNLKKYDGLIWGGSSLNIYNNTIEITRQIDFAKECFKHIKNILALCWGLQVMVTAAGGVVRKSKNGTHIGIAKNIEITENGIKHPIYKNKDKVFTTPAFNFDEVETTPPNSIHLSKNEINFIQGLNFVTGISNVWGLQYHPEITFDKMVQLIKIRKEKLLKKKCFNSVEEIEAHIEDINNEKIKIKKHQRMAELKNWLDYIGKK